MFTLLFLINYTFNPFDYLQNQNNINFDTINILGTSHSILIFSFDAKPNERFSIASAGKLQSSMNSSLIKICTTKVNFETLEDIENYNESVKIRYGLKMVHDSILFNLTWADTYGSYIDATIRLFLLKLLLLCPDKECADLYLDSLKNRL
jgi:hypothetical protein